jgi:hypothetical protein
MGTLDPQRLPSRGVNLRDHGDADFADSPPMTLAIATRTAIGL